MAIRAVGARLPPWANRTSTGVNPAPTSIVKR